MTIPLLIEPEQLANYADENARIVDLCSEQSYMNGHIPGAIHLPAQTLTLSKPPVPGLLPDLAHLERIFGYLGLNEDTHFFVYDDEGGGWAGRFIWTLDVIGHSHYSYINGGIFAWRGAGMELETEENSVEPTFPKLQIHNDPQVNVQELLDILGNDNVTIWDARSPEEYRGDKVLAARGGHIPGAINCEWISLMDPDKHYRIREDAEDRLGMLGIRRGQDIITHCQTHHRSAFTYMVGKILGFDIRAYPGSWSEWGNLPGTPVEDSSH